MSVLCIVPVRAAATGQVAFRLLMRGSFACLIALPLFMKPHAIREAGIIFICHWQDGVVAAGVAGFKNMTKPRQTLVVPQQGLP